SKRCQGRGDFAVFLSFEMVVIFDNPAAIYGSPLELYRFPRGKSIGRHANFSAHDWFVHGEVELFVRSVRRGIRPGRRISGLTDRAGGQKKTDKNYAFAHRIGVRTNSTRSTAADDADCADGFAHPSNPRHPRPCSLSRSQGRL